MDDEQLLSAFDRLVEDGTVLYDANQRTITHVDHGLKFQFIQSAALDKKPVFQNPSTQPTATQQQAAAPERRPGSDISTASFEIGTLGTTHVIAVNKFCYARPHLMLVTSDGHRRQHEPLDSSDLAAAREALAATSRADYVVIYNGGKDAGCSRLHKHMQLMPLEKGNFGEFLNQEGGGQEADVPFSWAFHRFDRDLGDVSVEKLVTLYYELLKTSAEAWSKVVSAETQAANVEMHGGAACPHNVVLTKRYMMVIPRRQAAVGKAAANAIGMLGVIAVATEKEADDWIQLGPSATLEALGVPRS